MQRDRILGLLLGYAPDAVRQSEELGVALEGETNGPVRPVYFPRRTELSGHSQAHLNAVARELNERARRTLGGLSPPQAFAEAVAPAG